MFKKFKEFLTKTKEFAKKWWKELVGTGAAVTALATGLKMFSMPTAAGLPTAASVFAPQWVTVLLAGACVYGTLILVEGLWKWFDKKDSNNV
tara:strand:- start:1440 stop:1715 length:276 start_codon:yes stop_codon:yes gene_type:complete